VTDQQTEGRTYRTANDPTDAGTDRLMKLALTLIVPLAHSFQIIRYFLFPVK
jgi:hypothetical protein